MGEKSNDSATEQEAGASQGGSVTQIQGDGNTIIYYGKADARGAGEQPATGSRQPAHGADQPLKTQPLSLALAWAWRWRAYLTAFGLAAFAMTAYLAGPALASQAMYLARVVTASGSTLPIRSDIVERVRQHTNVIARTLEPEFSEPSKYQVNGLVAAQLLLGANNESPDTGTLKALIHDSRNPACNCWKEVPQRPPGIFVAGWILSALAKYNIPTENREHRFLLTEQSPEGWWSMYPVNQRQEFASTYATSWALIALHSQLEQHLISAQDAEPVANAIRRGSTWLFTNHDPRARWKDYPLASDGKAFVSMSGLALHALHGVEGDAIRRLDKEWLDHLPPDVTTTEAEYRWITIKSGTTELDAFVHVQLPWSLIATADAFHDGNLLQRARALKWIEQSLETGLSEDDEKRADWWRAELVYAMRYITDRAAR